ncbi:flagellar assembly factor FliW [Paenibacillus rhizosphaerae]|uniref:Flagellar assembly factor FliW n=1 Tax=Paenibacillus rhizosphaerae TaxID=297318 RepID=A0A839TWL5_9BACL|nr:flagellar assembly protein FliW [Paenibacillus rhizosphaerae]MBB3130891.1 flagellar assembly factor FliW [Paenibacillus rhizosphaerae]
MVIETLSWGSLNISNNRVYKFPRGVPGFENETQFALIDGEEGPFYYLQSVKNKMVSFLLVDPFLFYPDYEFDLPDHETEELGIKDEVLIRCIVTVREPWDTSTINLLAPVVLNPKNLIGRQIVLNRANYRTKHGLLDFLINQGFKKDGE